MAEATEALDAEPLLLPVLRVHQGHVEERPTRLGNGVVPPAGECVMGKIECKPIGRESFARAAEDVTGKLIEQDHCRE